MLPTVHLIHEDSQKEHHYVFVQHNKKTKT